jgi:hypothetical protein
MRPQRPASAQAASPRSPHSARRQLPWRCHFEAHERSHDGTRNDTDPGRRRDGDTDAHRRRRDTHSDRRRNRNPDADRWRNRNPDADRRRNRDTDGRAAWAGHPQSGRDRALTGHRRGRERDVLG